MLTRVATFFFGPPSPERPSRRVRYAVDKQQAESEILISFFQLLIVGLFGVLYAISPKTFAPSASFHPVPWVLGLYATFTVVRFGLALRRHLPQWLIAASVIADVAMLLGLIWSFHLQYQQPPAFYLKAPTLLYIFIFIALRALRYEARFVILAGVSGALGWVGLVLLAVLAEPNGTAVTHDYVEYLTSAKVLIGAEVDKIVSILLVTGILTIGIVRSRRLLVRSASDYARARNLARLLPQDVVRTMGESEQNLMPGDGQLRDAAILSCDLRGFTKFAMQMPGTVVMSVLTEYTYLMAGIIEKHCGTIDKFMGDGIMATFGISTRPEVYAADALRCLQECAAAAAEWRETRLRDGKQPLDAFFAVTSGPVVFGAVGGRLRIDITVVGDAVNLAAKLEKHARVENVMAVTTAQCLATAREQGYRQVSQFELRPGRSVAGVSTRIDIAVLAAVAEPRPEAAPKVVPLKAGAGT